jgi:hypothetical protein
MKITEMKKNKATLTRTKPCYLLETWRDFISVCVSDSEWSKSELETVKEKKQGKEMEKESERKSSFILHTSPQINLASVACLSLFVNAL